MSDKWPALMLKKTALAYLDMGERAFEAEIASGRFPHPVLVGGRQHWRKDAIDRAISILGGEHMPDHIREFEEKIAARRNRAA